ncbi:COG4223 family protein [Aliihoeflea sp. PC F10.4]
MSKTPRSRQSGPKQSGSTIDIDPKDVKRIEGTTPAPEEGVSDITSKESMTPADDAKDAKPVEVKPAPVVPPASSAKVTPDTKPAEAAKAKPEVKPEPLKPTTAKPDDKPKASTATPSAFATKPASASTPPPARQDKRGSSALMGGVIGGLIVLALGAGLQMAGFWPTSEQQDDGRVIALQSEVDTLRADINQLRSATGDSAATNERLAALETAIADVGNAPDASAALAEVEQQLTSTGETSTQNASRLDAIEQSVTDLETRLAAAEETSPGQRIIAASALKSAIDRGQPFAGELDAYAALGGEGSELDDLRPYADAGVPTRAEINGEVETVARAMIAAGSGAAADAGLLDRLSASARSLIQVRPVGMAEGEDVSAIVARIETSVQQDDYVRAISEYESLPQDVQSAGADFIEKVRARHAADQLIDDALATALQDS